jgi:hypothetical protein
MMDRIWTPIVEPLLDLLGPKAIVAFPSPVHLLDERIGLYSRRTGADFRSIEAIGDGDSGGAEGPEGNTVNLRSAPIFGSFGASPDAVLIDGFEAWQRALPHLRALAARSHNDRQTRLPVVIVWDSGLLEDSVARSHPDQDVSENLSPDPVPEMIEFVSDSTAEIDVVDVAGVEGMGLLYATSVERDAPDVFEFIDCSGERS